MSTVPYHDAPEVVLSRDSPQVSYGEGPEIVQPGKEVVTSYDAPEYYGFEQKQAETANMAKRRIGGMSRRIFWIVLGVGVVVLLAIGGGIGGGLAANKPKHDPDSSSGTTGSAIPQSTTSISSSTISSSSLSTTTTPPTTTTITIPVATDIAGCPLANNTIFSAPSGSTFKKICYFDILGTNIDIHMVQVSTFDSCIGLCDSYNTENGEGECKSVVWDLVGGDYQDCWLKNATGGLAQNGVVGKANGTVAAILQS